MKEIKFNKDKFLQGLSNIQMKKKMDKEIIRISKQNPKKYVTVWVGWTNITFYIHNRKPGNDDGGAEATYRHYGGFFKNGEIIKPSKTWLSKFDFCPVSR